MKYLKTVLGVLLLAGIAIGLTAFGGPDVTQGRVQASLSQTFSNLYVDQQRLLGHSGVTAAAMRTTSSCNRRGGQIAPVGPGSDWVCQVSWHDDTGKAVTGKFEVQVHANSCWTASGPASLVGSFTIPDTAGRDVPNPVNAFDGCFDPDARAGAVAGRARASTPDEHPPATR